LGEGENSSFCAIGIENQKTRYKENHTKLLNIAEFLGARMIRQSVKRFEWFFIHWVPEGIQ
jgi:hypothetical protein